jgi:hypothetical protein
MVKFEISNKNGWRAIRKTQKRKATQNDTNMTVRPVRMMYFILFRLLMLVCAFFCFLYSIVQGLIRPL